MMTYWILGFAVGLVAGSGITILMNRNKCKHDWKFIKEVEYYYEGSSRPNQIDDLHQCSKCKEYKKVRQGWSNS